MNSYTVLLYVSVGLGAAVGGMARFGASGLAARLIGDAFPWGTLLVNVAGSALLGFLAGLTTPESRILIPGPTRLFLMVGVCGGFTSFSSFSLGTMNLMRDGRFWRASFNIGGSLAACLIGVWCGYVLAMMINQR